MWPVDMEHKKTQKPFHSFWCQAFNVTNRIVHSITISKIDKISYFFTLTINKTFLWHAKRGNIMQRPTKLFFINCKMSQSWFTILIGLQLCNLFTFLYLNSVKIINNLTFLCYLNRYSIEVSFHVSNLFFLIKHIQFWIITIIRKYFRTQKI